MAREIKERKGKEWRKERNQQEGEKPANAARRQDNHEKRIERELKEANAASSRKGGNAPHVGKGTGYRRQEKDERPS